MVSKTRRVTVVQEAGLGRQRHHLEGLKCLANLDFLKVNRGPLEAFK